MALAAVAHHQVHTVVHAPAVLRGAFVDATLARRLILAIRAVLPLIADLGKRDALATAAVKLAGGVAGTLLGSQTQAQAAVPLVAAIGAVLVPVAGEVSGYAAAIAALELVRPAGHVLAVGRVLVIAVRTVAVAVAEPAVMQAGDAVLALILVRQAGRGCLGDIRTGLEMGEK